MAEPKRSDAAAAAAPECVPSIGRVLDGRYRIEEQLGAGGVGAVYRGTQIALGRTVAIKILLEGVHPSFTQRFEREAKALASLRHPNIVTVTDYGVSEDTPFLIMELLEGETLAYRLMQGPMQPPEVLALTREILRALAFVHEQGLVHRDLKPGNVFIEKLPDGEQRLKLLDFGLAKFVQGHAAPDEPPVTRAGDIVGTPAYIAPEQVAGDDVDARTDTYAMGVMLFQMLAGRVPFEGEPVEQLKSHLVAKVPALGDKRPDLAVHPELERLLQRAMAKPRDARFQTCAEMLAALEAIPMPWLGVSERDARADPLAKTLRSDAPEASLDAPTQLRDSGPTDTQIIRHVRAYGTLALALISTLAMALTAFLIARDENTAERSAGSAARAAPGAIAKPPKAVREDAPAARARPAPQRTMTHTARAPAEGAPANGANAQIAVQEPRPHAVAPSSPKTPEPELEPVEAPAPESAQAPAPEPAQAQAPEPAQAPAPEPAQAPAPEPVLAEQPTEQASAQTAPEAPPQKQTPKRPPARNPWARGTPQELRGLRRAIAAGERGNDRAVAALRRYNRTSEGDPRGHLLLAHLYMNRSWRADVVNQYAIAYHLEPSARGAPEMLRDLLEVVAYGSSGTNEAGRLIREAYGREALPAIDRAMNAYRKDIAALARLTTLRVSIAGRQAAPDR